MEEPKVKDQHLLDECKTISESCLYTAQAHFVLAKNAETQTVWFLIIPSIIAAFFGILVTIGCPAWLAAFSALGGVISAIGSALGVGDKSIRYKSAANLFTVLRQEARSLHETYSKELSHTELAAETRRINDRYNTLVQALDITDEKAYKKARDLIKSGIFKPDFRDHKVNSEEDLSK